MPQNHAQAANFGANEMRKFKTPKIEWWEPMVVSAKIKPE